jgi:hypothetical protein
MERLNEKTKGHEDYLHPSAALPAPEKGGVRHGTDRCANGHKSDPHG